MTMEKVEREAERLYRELHGRRRIGFVSGFRGARLTLRAGGERSLRDEIRDYRPSPHFQNAEDVTPLPPDEYDAGYKEGMEAALRMFMET